jgi:hypothetical protein
VGLLDTAEVGSRAFISGSTGRLLNERRLASELTEFVDAAPRYAPREWALRNIACRQSSRTLNEALRSAALAAGERWTRDIEPLYWRPDPVLCDPDGAAAWTRNEFAFAETHFGIRIGQCPAAVADPVPVLH